MAWQDHFLSIRLRLNLSPYLSPNLISLLLPAKPVAFRAERDEMFRAKMMTKSSFVTSTVPLLATQCRSNNRSM